MCCERRPAQRAESVVFDPASRRTTTDCVEALTLEGSGSRTWKSVQLWLRRSGDGGVCGDGKIVFELIGKDAMYRLPCPTGAESRKPRLRNRVSWCTSLPNSSAAWNIHSSTHNILHTMLDKERQKYRISHKRNPGYKSVFARWSV